MEQADTIGVPAGGPQTPSKSKWISWKWTVVAIVLLFGYFAWQCGSGLSAGASLSDDAVRHFHAQLDAQEFDDIVSQSDQAFQNSDSHAEIVKFLSGVHAKLGASRSFNRANLFVNATTGGTFIKVTYSSAFEQGNAVEAFTWKKEGGHVKLVRYDVNSKVFLTR